MTPTRRLALLAATALLLAGCPQSVSDPPPPPRKPEIPAAPPRALGAQAAGTDDAPHPELTTPGAEAEPDLAPPPVVPPPVVPPSGSAAPHPHVTPAPDAGMAL